MSIDLIKERINEIKKALKSGDPQEIEYFSKHIKESGLKSLLIVPIFQEFLGFTSMKHYGFEVALSEKALAKQPAIDILIDEQMVIETKNFNYLANEKTRKDAEAQTKFYIKPKGDKIEYGILTDGVLWEFFIDTAFISRVSNEGSQVADMNEDIPLCITFDIMNEYFFELLSMFHKDIYQANIKKLSDGILKTIKGTPGGFGWQNLFAKVENTEIQSKCGKFIKQKIEEQFRIKKGEFYDDIKAGKTKEGVLYKIEDQYICLVFKVISNGFIQIIPEQSFLKPGNPKDVLKMFPKITELLFSHWLNDSSRREYETIDELLLDILNTQRMTNYGKEIKGSLIKI